MLVKDIVDTDFVNYKNPAMFIATCYCTFKCCKEQNLPISICQNNAISKQPNYNISNDDIYKRYINNLMTSAICIGGLEPFLQFDELLELIEHFRNRRCLDMFIVYTGYYYEEIKSQIIQLQQYPNIIIKYGRFKPNQTSHYDEILGINLISNNQYAERLS